LVSISTSQILAEKLMDIRYLFMASISDYSQAHKLVEEKLKPPYPTLFIRWVIETVSKSIPLIGKKSITEQLFFFKTPVYSGYQAADR
jgi:hypothetical protein